MIKIVADCADCLRTYSPYDADHIREFLLGLWTPAHWNTVAPWILDRDRRLCRVPLKNGLQCLATATEVDHIVPRTRGGGHEASNLRAACRPCNHFKLDRLDSEMYELEIARGPGALPGPRALPLIGPVGSVEAGSLR